MVTFVDKDTDVIRGSLAGAAAVDRGQCIEEIFGMNNLLKNVLKNLKPLSPAWQRLADQGKMG
jgi:hypothetical protein